MKIKLILLFSLLLSILMVIQSCKNKNENETNISYFGNDNSHNMGQNCMNCHKPGGAGEGWFNIAGTVYDSLNANTYPNSTIRLYSGPNGTGTLRYTVEGDALGNFYTTENVDFGTGLYATVTGNSSTQYMSSSITIGKCNSCHGVSTAKLWVK
jgi:hypothetical protein